MEDRNGSTYLNVRQAARTLGVHENTIRNWVRTGLLMSSRVPGSGGHRFARTEIDRLQRTRGSAVSSIAPALRTENPELVGAIELAHWATREDSKGAFPELMRRLLASTPGISELRVPVHEGVAEHGWDGSAASAGSTYLPTGTLLFEFGTTGDVKRKAQSDYDKRVDALPKDKDAIFVFATPRRWPGASEWARNRNREGRFRGVAALDAQTLEAWLQSTPAVHHWISERLGYRPREVRTLETWWGEFSHRTDPVLPYGFHLAGRMAQAEELTARLRSARVDEPIAVRAPWREEAIAFLAAALDKEPDLSNRALLISDRMAWDRVVEMSSPLILIPLFGESPDIRSATARGHRVVVVADASEVVRAGSGTISLPKVDYETAREALRTANRGFHETDRMVALARRSMPSLFRSLSRDPRRQSPDWLTDPEQVAALAPLMLVGSWGSAEGDRQVLEQLTRRSPDDIDRLLTSLAGGRDAPFTRSGGLWRLTSPVEMASLLLPRLTPNDLDAWEHAVSSVLLETNPFRDMDDIARFTATSHGRGLSFSETLRTGVSRGLALVSSTADSEGLSSVRRRLDQIVHALLAAANDDDSGRTWVGLADALPDLAEASPEIFQDAVDENLSHAAPSVIDMFEDGRRSMFGSGSPHTSLLWALERMSWSPEYFGRATSQLAHLAALDPGGELSNRPIESLQNILIGWRAQSGGDVTDKLLVIERMLAAHPTVGWQTLLAVWPQRHSTTFPPAQPRYRDWGPSTDAVSYSEYFRYVHGLASLATDAAGLDVRRWCDLVPKLDELPSNERRAALEVLQRNVSSAEWTPHDRHDLWAVITAEADRHSELADADWALPADDVDILRTIAQGLEQDDPRRYSALFGWPVRVSELSWGDDGYEAALEHERLAALGEVLSTGSRGVEALVRDVEMPHAIGHLLAMHGLVSETDILEWLRSDDPKLRSAALAFVRERLRHEGLAWLPRSLAALSGDGVAAAALMSAVPLSREYWTFVDTLDERLVTAYLTHSDVFGVPDGERADAVAHLVERGHTWRAIDLLGLMLYREQHPDADLVKTALNAAIAAGVPAPNSASDGYHVGQLLAYLEASAVDDADLVGLEFAFFDRVHDFIPSRALYRSLGRDPGGFVDMVRAVFRAEGEAKRTPKENESAFIRRAFEVLWEWPTLPGTDDDGNIDADRLSAWVRAARLALSDSGHGSIGDEKIGEVLSASPRGADGVWPAEPVRRIIEDIGSTRLETGFSIGKTNRRGVTSRGAFVGGDQERELEGEYRGMASAVATRWPRTARILRGIADSYRSQAQREDARAERDAEDG